MLAMVTATVIEVVLHTQKLLPLTRLHKTLLAALVSPALIVTPAVAQTNAPAAAGSTQTKQTPASATGSASSDQTGGVIQNRPDSSGVTLIGVGRRTNTERSLQIIPGFSAGFTASDNIDLLPAQRREAGNLFEVTPFVEVRVRRPGSTADLSASVRAQKFTDSQFVDDRLDGNLAASGDLSIVDNRLRLRGDADLFRIDETGLGGTAVTGGARTQNTTLFRSLRVSPYSVGRIGLASDYEIGYEYELIDRGLQNDSNRVFGEIQNTSLGDGRLGLLARVDASQVSYENDFEYDNISGLLGASWALTGRFKVGLGAYYTAIDVLENSDGENSSVGPALYWDWRASERSAFQGQVADTYYGDNIAIRFRQLFKRWVLSANYRKSVEDGNRASTFLFRPIDSFEGSTRRTSDTRLNEFNAQLTERDLDFNSGSELFVASVNSALVRDDTVSISAAHIRPRIAGLVSLFTSDRSAATETFSANSDQEVNQWGGYGVVDYRMNSRNSLRLVGQYRRTDLPTSGESALFNGVDLSWRYNLNSRAWLRLGVRHSIQDGDGGADSYKETAGTLTYNYRYR